MIWRPVQANYASLEEVSKLWTLSDLMDAHEILDAIDLQQVRQAQRTKDKNRGRN